MTLDDCELVGNNSVIKSTVTAESMKPDTLEDELLLSTKLQPDEEVEVRKNSIAIFFS